MARPVNSDDILSFMDSCTTARSSSTPPEGPHATHVIDGVWVGSVQDAHSVDFLTANDITHVLNCGESYLTTRVNQVGNRAIIKHSLNARDDDEFPVEQLLPAIHFVANAVASGGRVLIYCYAGMNRSVTVALAYVAVHHPELFRQIFGELAAKRPGMLSNRRLRTQLASFVVDAEQYMMVYSMVASSYYATIAQFLITE